MPTMSVMITLVLGGALNTISPTVFIQAADALLDLVQDAAEQQDTEVAWTIGNLATGSTEIALAAPTDAEEDANRAPPLFLKVW